VLLCWQPRQHAYTCWNTASGARTLNWGTRIDHILAAGPAPEVLLPTTRARSSCPVDLPPQHDANIGCLPYCETLPSDMHSSCDMQQPLTVLVRGCDIMTDQCWVRSRSSLGRPGPATSLFVPHWPSCTSRSEQQAVPRETGQHEGWLKGGCQKQADTSSQPASEKDVHHKPQQQQQQQGQLSGPPRTQLPGNRSG